MMDRMTNWTRRALLVCMVCLLCGGIFPAPRRAGAASVQRVAILLDGYGTSSADVPFTFATIKHDALNQAAYIEQPSLFSYRYPAGYTSAATYTALPSAAVAALHRTIADEIARDPAIQIDLIGYSLGGNVAVQYISTYGSSPEGQHVRHVITLDSPINGTSHARLVMLAAALNQQPLLGSSTGRYLVAEGRDRNTRSANIATARRLAPTTSILTLDSHDDWIVPPGDGEILGFSQEFRLGRNYNACLQGIAGGPGCLGHDRVLRDARVMAAIRTALTLPTAAPPAR